MVWLKLLVTSFVMLATLFLFVNIIWPEAKSRRDVPRFAAGAVGGLAIIFMACIPISLLGMIWFE